MKKLICAAVLCLLASLSAFATTITVSSQTTAWTYGGTTAKLLIWNSETFFDSDGTPHLGGQVGNTSTTHQIVNCTISGGIVTIPSFTIASTTNSTDRPAVTYTAVFYDQNNVKRDVYMASFKLPAAIAGSTTYTWAQIRTYNNVPPKPQPNIYPNLAEIEQLFHATAAGSLVKMTDSVYGIGRLATPAANTADPKLVGDNDPRVPTQAENDALVGTSGSPSSSNKYVTNSDPRVVNGSATTNMQCSGTDDTGPLLAAIAAGGTIQIAKGVTCAGDSTVSFPSSVTLKIDRGGLLKPITGQTVRILGYPDIGIYRAFTNATAGLGTIAFNTIGLVDNHNLGLAIYPEWWGATADNSTDNALTLQAAEKALETAQNGVLWFSTGYYLTSAAIQITEVQGITWMGAGREVTRVRATGGTPAVQCNGIWRSHFQGIQFDTTVQITGNRAVFEMDGSYDGIHFQGVQGNVVAECYFNARQLADYALALGRQGGGNAQGSENSLRDNNFDGATVACLYNNGFNALNNTLSGGNFQSYPKDGVLLNGGSMNIFSVGFQSTFGYTQVANGGFDIHVGAAGTGEPINVIGCRTESYQFFGGTNVQPGVLIGNYAISGGSAWVANSPFALNYSVMKAVTVGGIAGITQLYRVTTAGTSGGSEPTWCNTPGCTNADGTAVWTQTDFKNVDGTLGGSPGLMTMIGNNFLNGTPGTWRDQVIIPQTATATDPYYIFQNITWAYDVSAGSIVRSLASAPVIGQIITVVKTENSANTVTVSGNGKLINGSATQVIPGSSMGWISVQYDGTAWRILSKSFDLDAITLNGKTFASPAAIGTGTPAAITGTTITANTMFSGPHNGTVGDTSPSTIVGTTIVGNTSLTVNGGTALTTTNQTGTGSLVMAVSPTLTGAPAIAAATGTSLAASSFLKVNNTGKLTVAPKTNDTYSNAMTIDVTISHHVIAVSNTTSATSTWTPSAAGSAGDLLVLTTESDGSGTVTVTFAATFHSSGTQATTLSRFSTIVFVSDGTRWIELFRTTALA